MRFIVLDTETGGLDPKTSSLLSVAMLLADDKFNTHDIRHAKCRPNTVAGQQGAYQVEASAMKVNGINIVRHDQEAVCYSDISISILETLKRWRATAEGESPGDRRLMVVGHNVNFDLGFIWHHLIPKPIWEQYCSYRTLDTSSIIRYLQLTGKLPSGLSGSLKSICTHLGIDVSGHHDAKMDARMTLSVLRCLCGKSLS